VEKQACRLVPSRVAPLLRSKVGVHLIEISALEAGIPEAATCEDDRLLAEAFWKADMLRRLNLSRTCRDVNTAIQKSGLSARGTAVSFPE
jgi:hypothetical protein